MHGSTQVYLFSLYVKMVQFIYLLLYFSWISMERLKRHREQLVNEEKCTVCLETLGHLCFLIDFK